MRHHGAGGGGNGGNCAEGREGIGQRAHSGHWRRDRLGGEGIGGHGAVGELVGVVGSITTGQI